MRCNEGTVACVCLMQFKRRGTVTACFVFANLTNNKDYNDANEKSFKYIRNSVKLHFALIKTHWQCNSPFVNSFGCVFD